MVLLPTIAICSITHKFLQDRYILYWKNISTNLAYSLRCTNFLYVLSKLKWWFLRKVDAPTCILIVRFNSKLARSSPCTWTSICAWAPKDINAIARIWNTPTYSFLPNEYMQWEYTLCFNVFLPNVSIYFIYNYRSWVVLK